MASTDVFFRQVGIPYTASVRAQRRTKQTRSEVFHKNNSRQKFIVNSNHIITSDPNQRG